MNAFALLLLPTLCAPEAADGDFSWPQWDGPQRSGVSTETSWSSTGAAEDLWRVELGLGYSTVSVSDGRVFSMGYDEEAGLDSVWCLDALTGELLWRHSYESKIWNLAHEGGTVNTPSVDAELVYSMNREGNLYCLGVEDGELVWHNDLMGDGNPHELEIPTWGFSASPLIVGEEMFVNCGRLLSIDKQTGEVLWRSEDYGDGYGTPIAFEHDGDAVLAVHNGTSVAVIDQQDGSELYALEFGGEGRGVNSATPVLIGDSLFVSSSTLPGGARFRLGEDALEPVWQNREMVNSLSGCVKVGEHLYGFDGRILKCLGFDGETAWEERGIGNGAVLAAGERLLVMGASGELIVAQAQPDAFEELSRVELFEGGRNWSRPILVNGIVYCRNSRGALVARDHRE